MTRTILVTGATSGIGKASTEQLIRQGHRLIVLARNATKVESLCTELLQHYPDAVIEPVIADLSDLDSVKVASDKILSSFKSIDTLLNNAGGIVPTHQLSRQGYEMTLASNHIGHFLLTLELLPLLQNSEDARVVNVSSAAHKSGKLDFNDLHMKKSFTPFKAYCNAKLANVYFTFELHRRFRKDGISCNALHPGVINTGFGNDLTGFWKFILDIGKPLLTSPRKGAATNVFLASSDSVKGKSGAYFQSKKEVKAGTIAYDKVASAQLWEESMKMISYYKPHQYD